MQEIKQNPILKDFQEYLGEMIKERGFEKTTITEILMLFFEECGELAKAIRKNQNIKSDDSSQKFYVENEVADVFIYLLDICNNLNIDLEKAFREKEKINNTRIWK